MVFQNVVANVLSIVGISVYFGVVFVVGLRLVQYIIQLSWTSLWPQNVGQEACLGVVGAPIGSFGAPLGGPWAPFWPPKVVLESGVILEPAKTKV